MPIRLSLFLRSVARVLAALSGVVQVWHHVPDQRCGLANPGISWLCWTPFLTPQLPAARYA